MKIIYTPTHEQHNPPHEILGGELVSYYEAPRRLAVIHAAFEQAGIDPFVPPQSFGTAPIVAVHDAAYLAYLEHAYERWVAAGLPAQGVAPTVFPVGALQRHAPHPFAEAGYYAFDLSTPIVAGTYAAVRSSANVALTGAALLRAGERVVYALCRPPGHHAGRAMSGGYCFLNNAAIAAHELAQTVEPEGQNAALQRAAWGLEPATVAVLDIDFHHGNGTQEIFYHRSDVLFVSIHADPAREYPYFLGHADERGAGAGEGYNHNLPLAAAVDDSAYLAVLDVALNEITAYNPRYLVVSVGFDTFAGDPQGDFALSSSAFTAIGERIVRLGLPTLLVQEGGYAVDDLGRNAVNLVQAFGG